MIRARMQKMKAVCFAALAALIILGLPRTSAAKAKARINFDPGNVRQGEVHVAKGETVNEDIVASGPVTVDGTLNGDCVSLGGPVTVNGEVLGEIATFGAPVNISGTVKGDIATMGGPVQISGVVKGEIASLGGPVTLQGKAVVLGDIALMGGKLTKPDTASVKGEIVQMDWGMMKRFIPLVSRYRGGKGVSKAFDMLSPRYRLMRYAAFLAFTAGIGLMVLLLAAFLPKQIETVAGAIKQDFWKSVGIGTLIVVLIFPGLLLMTVSILGIPLIPLAILLLCAALLMSLGGFSLILAERFHDSLKKPTPSTLAGVGIGYVLLTSLFIVGKLMKVAGGIGSLFGGIFVLANLMVISCAILVGLGAIWMTRMGNRKDGGKPGLPVEAQAGLSTGS